MIKHKNSRLLYAMMLLFIIPFSCTENKAEEANQHSAPMDENIALIEHADEEKVDVWIKGELFTSYRYSDEFKKPILYPIKTAQGKTVSRGFPLDPRPGESDDHPHQVGLWLNYGDVNGLDFWNHSDAIPEERKNSYGTIVHKEISGIRSGTDRAEMDVVMEWTDPEGDVLLLENTTFVFHGSGNTEEDTGFRIIDRFTRLEAPAQNISLTDNKEGMLGMRVTRELEHPDEHEAATGIYRSSEGLEGHDVWGTRARWMSLSGIIDESPVSVIVFDHPDNTGYPTYWHARGYGLFAANPLGMKEMSGGKEELNFSLAAGESAAFRYRIMITSGDEVLDEQIEEYWEKWLKL